MIFAALLLLASPARALWWGPSAQSQWTGHTLQIDGGDEEWKDRTFDDDQGFSFAISNDETELYVFFRPRTAWNKQQLSAAYGQELALWLDPKAGKRGYVGLRLPAPEKPGGARALELIGVTTAAVSGQAEAVVGDLEARGGLEARIPLSWLGTPRPKRFSLGLLASTPKNPPKPSATGRRLQAHTPSPLDEPETEGYGGGRIQVQKLQRARPDPAEENYEPVRLWLRVTLAEKGEKK